MNNDLVPPKENAVVLGAAHAVLPLFLSWQKLDVIPSANCVNTIRRLRGTQTVIALNHADRFDPVVAFALSKICGENFYYMAARELFDQKFFGWFMQNCGAYSVVRGMPEDVPSKELTVELIAHGSRKLIEFPEGDVTGRDDAILPLKEDGLRNIMEAQSLTQGGSPINVLPTSIFYEVLPDAVEALEAVLTRMESKLMGRAKKGQPLEGRVKALLVRFISDLGSRYQVELKSIDQSSIVGSIRELCRSLVLRFADTFRIEPNRSRNEVEMLYDLRADLRKRGTVPECEKDFNLLQQLLILASTLEQPFTKESAWRIIDRLEQEILGRSSIKGSRVAWIECGAPIVISDVLSQHPPRDAILLLDSRIRAEMLRALQVMQSKSIGPTSDRQALEI